MLNTTKLEVNGSYGRNRDKLMITEKSRSDQREKKILDMWPTTHYDSRSNGFIWWCIICGCKGESETSPGSIAAGTVRTQLLLLTANVIWRPEVVRT